MMDRYRNYILLAVLILRLFHVNVGAITYHCNTWYLSGVTVLTLRVLSESVSVRRTANQDRTSNNFRWQYYGCKLLATSQVLMLTTPTHQILICVDRKILLFARMKPSLRFFGMKESYKSYEGRLESNLNCNLLCIMISCYLLLLSASTVFLVAAATRRGARAAGCYIRPHKTEDGKYTLQIEDYSVDALFFGYKPLESGASGETFFTYSQYLLKYNTV
ncbi:hypothetical protein BDQ17DRAFT_796181 [Cyathus striatus]|nr:hypothetical protein BDQ17DRAFT_796181 [Cyathus striatus]